MAGSSIQASKKVALIIAHCIYYSLFGHCLHSVLSSVCDQRKISFTFIVCLECASGKKKHVKKNQTDLGDVTHRYQKTVRIKLSLNTWTLMFWIVVPNLVPRVSTTLSSSAQKARKRRLRVFWHYADKSWGDFGNECNLVMHLYLTRAT